SSYALTTHPLSLSQPTPLPLPSLSSTLRPPPPPPLFPYTTLFRSPPPRPRPERRHTNPLRPLRVPANHRLQPQPRHRHAFCQFRSEEHTSELQSRFDLVCRLLLEKKKTSQQNMQPNKHPSPSRHCF